MQVVLHWMVAPELKTFVNLLELELEVVVVLQLELQLQEVVDLVVQQELLSPLSEPPIVLHVILRRPAQHSPPHQQTFFPLHSSLVEVALLASVA